MKNVTYEAFIDLEKTDVFRLSRLRFKMRSRISQFFSSRAIERDSNDTSIESF